MLNTTKKITVVVLMLVLTFGMNSCMVTKTPVGKYTETRGEVYRYAKGKQVYLFWGLIPAGRTKVATPTDGTCMVVGKNNFGDLLISLFTGGFVTTRTIKVYGKRVNNVSELPLIKEQTIEFTAENAE